MKRFFIMLLLTAGLCVSHSYGQNLVAGGSRLSGQRGVSSAVGVQMSTASPLVAPSTQRSSSPHALPGVRRRVPQDYATIQEGIDASSDGDTVLVSEGTYVENIRYRGKAIVVGSLYLVDSDTAHITKTVIDGSGSTLADSGSVVYFVNSEDTTSVLYGFTIQGGTGTRHYFIWMYGNFWAKAGGGIYCNNAGAKILHNIIRRNRIFASVPVGGGVDAFGTILPTPYIILGGNVIAENSVHGSSTTAGQWAGSGGVDLTGVQARVISNIIEKDTAIGIRGAYGGGMSLIGAINGRWPSAEITGNVFRSNSVSAQWEGSDGAGLELEFTGDVMISDNTFEGNAGTCANGGVESEGGGVRITDQDVVGCGRKVLVRNKFLGNTVSCDGLTGGGGLLFYQTQCTVSNCVFRENAALGVGDGLSGSAGGGGAIKGAASSFTIENCIFADNYSRLDGGALLFVEGNVPGFGTDRALINCTVVDNDADRHGGGIVVHQTPTFVSFNNIFWSDTAADGENEIMVTDSITGVTHCDVQGGYAGSGNISADPVFVSGDAMFNLSPASPCIGKGVDSVQAGGTWYCAPTCDFDGHLRPQPVGTHPDIGVQEDQVTTTVNVELVGSPKNFVLEQNYPNPFNPSTTIRYSIASSMGRAEGSTKPVDVKLVVFDLLGREVATLVDGYQTPGTYTIVFNASKLSSGMYVYRLTAGGQALSRKLVLLR